MRPRTEAVAVVGLLVLAVAWLRRPEGFVDDPVLWTVTKTHGIHIGDLLAVVPVTLAVWLVIRRYRR